MSDIKQKKKRKKKKERSYSLYWLGLRYNDFFFFSFSCFMKQDGIHDIRATDNTRAIRCRRRGNYIYELYF